MRILLGIFGIKTVFILYKNNSLKLAIFVCNFFLIFQNIIVTPLDYANMLDDTIYELISRYELIFEILTDWYIVPLLNGELPKYNLNLYSRINI